MRASKLLAGSITLLVVLGAALAGYSVIGGERNGTDMTQSEDGDDSRSLTVEWTTPLTEAGVQMMPPPVLGDVDGGRTSELVAVTNDGRITVVEPSTGRVVATHTSEGRSWTRPTLVDTDADGVSEIYVVYGDGRVVRFSAASNRE